MSPVKTNSESKLNEILGVVLLGFAALACAAVYFSDGGVFGSISRSFIFGTVGAFGYIVPVALAAVGIYVIAARSGPVYSGKRLLAAVALLIVLSMWHLNVASIISLPNGSYGMFLEDSYDIGATTHSGGGVLGGLLTYWTYTYLGMSGSWIVLIVGLAVCVLAVTNLSLRKLSAGIGTAFRSTYAEHRTRLDERRDQRRMYAETAAENMRVRSGEPMQDMRVQPIEVRRKVGGRRKTPVQPELDPPFSVSTPPVEKKQQDMPPQKKRKPTFADNVIDLSRHRAEHRTSRSLKEDTPPFDVDDTSESLVVNASPVSVPEPEPPAIAEDYDPEPYREVFADTDIQFEDDPVPDVREKRRIDPELVERVTGKYAKVGSADQMSGSKYHVETGRNRAGTAAVIAADTDSRVQPVSTPGYRLPPLDLLDRPSHASRGPSAELQKNAALLEETLRTFNIEAHVVNILQGPVVTRYELEPAPGIKVSSIVQLTDNIAMTLAASTVRIEAPIPGKSVVGIEIPNKVREMVGLRELLEDPKYASVSSPVAFALGKDITGTPVYADIAKMPHLLVAGQTGAGKSVCINSLIVSILYRSSPDEVQMLMIDPKQVELSGYNPIPHLISEVVTDAKKAPLALNWAVNEMNQRYTLFKKNNARNLKGYNDMLQAEGEKKLPHILIVVDELAELMMISKKEVEEAIQRIAQLGRAAGMHLVIATQRPTTNVITGLIKANVPGRIGFSVKSQIDSRTILDTKGAEKLLGKGDMLFYTTGLAAPERIQGCNVSDAEIARVVEFVKDQQGSRSRVEFEEEERESNAQMLTENEDEGRDKLFYEAMQLAVENDGVSTSFLQRRLRIGYGRAARLLDELQLEGIISGPNGSKAREVLISREDYERLYGGEGDE